MKKKLINRRMNIEIEFNYQGQNTIIQCNTQDNLNNIFQSFINKANIDINLIYFLYSGDIIEGNSIIDQIINNQDKERKKMNILVNNKDDTDDNTMIIKPKDISCPKCGEISRINITDYKILLQCKNGHNKGNILLNEYKNTQKIDISKITCINCNKNNKFNSCENEFFRCLTCNSNLCPLCKSFHDKEHKIINYDLRNYICIKHNELFNRYCNKCKLNICIKCENEHKNHKSIYLHDLKSYNLLNEMNEFKKRINDLNKNIKNIILKLNYVIYNIEIYYRISNNIIYNYEKLNIVFKK